VILVRITDKLSWEQAKTLGVFHGEFEDDGFVHLLKPDQVQKVANLAFTGHNDLMLLVLHRARIHSSIQDEDIYGVGELFPCLYGALNLEAVMMVLDFPVSADGLFQLPHRLTMLMQKFL
jgi:uncharacterized protein (DUF952 family)